MFWLGGLILDGGQSGSLSMFLMQADMDLRGRQYTLETPYFKGANVSACDKASAVSLECVDQVDFVCSV